MTQTTDDALSLQRQCIHELFEAQALAHPNAPAVVAGDTTVTFAELNAQANRLAHHLRSLGVKPDLRVAISVERSVEMIVGILAVLKAGGCYVPLDPSYPTERLRYMLADSDPHAVLVPGPVLTEVPSNRSRAICVDLRAEPRSWQAQPSTNIHPDDVGLSARHLAYVIYTSGSTGQPKGVSIEHRSLCNLVGAEIEYLNVRTDSRILQVSSFNFDASVFEIFMALCGGAALYLADLGTLLVGEALACAIERDAISHLTLTPTVLETLPEHSQLASLKTLVVAGEPLSAGSARRWATGRRLINAYGPTEATVCATWYECAGDLEKAPPIGRPLPNVSIHVLDRFGQPLPVGEPGELFIGGAGVARGYLGRPDLTAERFVHDPFSDAPDASMFKTGDVGRYLSDGNIEFLGRDDDQVKIRGIRIEIGEVEAQLAAHQSVQQARVIVREDNPGHKRLTAYYTAKHNTATGARALHDHVSRILPEYMAPTAYVRVDALPFTPNGKIDCRLLPAPQQDDYVVARYEAPVGELEAAMARLWAEVLGVERVGRGDHFFKLGGDSLRGTMLISRIRAKLALDASIKQLFSFPVLSELARALGQTARVAAALRLPGDDQHDLVLSFAQKRLWFLAQLGGASRAYHIAIGPTSWIKPSGLRLKGSLDRHALRRALDRLNERHESLRSTFVNSHGEPSLRIGSASTGLALQERDVRNHADAAGELARLKREESRADFDLELGPLIRGQLVQVADDEHVLLLTTHHIVCDGWSAELLLEELGLFYGAYREGKGEPLPPLSLQYTDYARWQKRWLTDEAFHAQAEYWKRQLHGAPTSLDLVADRPRPVQQDFAGDFVDIDIDEDLTRQLKQLSERRNATLYTTLLAGWAALLGRLSGQEDVVVGTPFAGRTRPDVEALVGSFVNTVAVRIDMSERPSIADLLDRVATQTLGAQQHQDLPFEQVVELVNPPRDPSRAPLFQVMFAWQNHALAKVELPGLVVIAEETSDFSAKFDLELRIGEADGRIVGVLEYATSLFERATIERHIEYLRTMLRAMVADELQSITNVDLVSDQERQLLLKDGNTIDTVRPPAMPECIHTLFEEQVARTPDAVALIHEDRELTYRETNAKANRLACHLRRMGVGPDSRVAICLERSVEMVIGILGVLKAGGAFVPLDPSYPYDRLAHMLIDSDASVLLVHDQTPRTLQERLRATRDQPIPIVDLEREDWGDAPQVTLSPAEIGLATTHLTYVIYTSGSTGKPKGVGLPHAALFNLIKWQTSCAEPLTTLQFAALSFDVSLQEIFSALCSGSKLVLVDNQTRRDPRKLFQVVCGKKVERLFLPCVALQMLADALDDDSVADCALRDIITAGEQLRITPAIARFFGRLRNCRLRNHYGPTETHVVTAFTLPRDVAEWPELPPIGRPVADARVYILDRYGQLAPRGGIGELYIGGAVLARGYLQQPELTAERFLPDPFAAQTGARMYKTGDLARYRSDGDIEFLGRNDLQVKIRGFRVELGEIEARLATHPAVQTAVVVARGDGMGSKRLIAYYTASAPVAVNDLRKHLAAVLPEHMMPASYVALAQLPLTPSGKLNRAALPDPPSSMSPPGDAPMGEVEKRIAGMWAELLDIERVDRTEHFFELGGHSLLATVLLMRIRSEFEVELALEDLFKAPVLTDFARVVVIKQLARFAAADA